MEISGNKNFNYFFIIFREQLLLLRLILLDRNLKGLVEILYICSQYCLKRNC